MSWAKRNGFETGYNNPVTKDRTAQIERKKTDSFPVAYCPVCQRAFETKQSNGKGNKDRKILKPEYMPDWYPSLSLERLLCGFDKCYNEPN